MGARCRVGMVTFQEVVRNVMFYDLLNPKELKAGKRKVHDYVANTTRLFLPSSRHSTTTIERSDDSPFGPRRPDMP